MLSKCKIEDLNLSTFEILWISASCGISERALNVIKPILKESSTISKLNMSNNLLLINKGENKIGPIGGKLFGEILKENKSIVTLIYGNL